MSRPSRRADDVTPRRTALERITALEERFDAFEEKLDMLIGQGVERGQATIEMRSDIAGLRSSVAGLKGDTLVIRRALFLARVGGQIGRFVVWLAPLAAGLFVYLGDRWELLLNFHRGSGR